MSIRKYNGHLGMFVYDDTIFSIADDKHGSLIYIGDETDGSKIIIPDGVIDISKTFIHSDIETPPVIPASVKCMDYTFMNTPLKQMPYIPDGVLSMNYCFADDSKLSVRTIIPLSVQSKECAFDNCPDDYKVARRNISMKPRPRHFNIFVTGNKHPCLRHHYYAGYAKV